LSNNDILPAHAYPTLISWHAGLSCQIALRPRQSVLFDCDSCSAEEFKTFWNEEIDEVDERDAVTYRRFRVFMLKKGTGIPPKIAIEQDGENHVSVFPKEEPFNVTKDTSWSSFQVDDFLPLVSKWKAFAVLELKASGLAVPSYFPPDNESFPVRQFLEEIVLNGTPENALQTSDAVSLLIKEEMSLFNYLRVMIAVGNSHLLKCDGNSFLHVVQPCVRALQFWLTLLEASKMDNFSFWMKSKTLTDESQEKKLVQSSREKIVLSSRRECHLEGGHPVSVVEVIGSIDILFLNVRINSSSCSAPVYLPFWYEDEILGMKVLFDEIDVLPFVEEEEDPGAKCSFLTSAAYPRSEDFPEKVVIELNRNHAVSVLVSAQEKATLLQSTACCSGYVASGRRCKNKRKNVERKRVWCHHHVHQRTEFENFLKFGEVPQNVSVWWTSSEHLDMVEE
jgi:hypothetical protein